MISEQIRSLLYPLGFLASFLFAARVFVQWITSEKKKQSHVSHTFWVISLSANLIMTLHSFIQLQYPICIIQALNAVIAWRNLALMRRSLQTWKAPALWMGLTTIGLTFLFWLQGTLIENTSWMRPPKLPWSQEQAHSILWTWHLIGIAGICLFASRFWIQWWVAERHRISALSRSFWWVSLVGSVLSLAYFFRLHDIVNIVSYGTGLIPYLRNLVLIRRQTNLQPPRKNSLFVFAGEQSGDLIGGSLLKALKQKCPTLHLYGVGGAQMRSHGLNSLMPMESFQVMGVSAVLKAFPRLFFAFRKIQKEIINNPPEAVVLIDYPDFNMLLEKKLRRKGYQGKLIHYVSPTVWAWRRSRVKTLAKTLDLLLAIFPFEKAYYKTTTLSVTYVGHPLVSLISKHAYQPQWRSQCQLTPQGSLLAIFPGSRKHEIESNLPVQIEAARLQLQDNPGLSLAISVARSDLEPLIRTFLPKDIPIALVPGEFRYELMKESEAALATSGTVTLELALHAVPTVVTYSLSRFNYLVGRYLFRIRLQHICIVNIIAGKTVFPECVDLTLSSERVADVLQTLLQQSLFCKKACANVKRQLINQDASEKAADAIFQLIQRPS